MKINIILLKQDACQRSKLRFLQKLSSVKNFVFLSATVSTMT